MAEKARNSQLQLDFYGVNSDVPARTPPQKESVHSEKSTSSHSICSEQSRLDGTQKDIGTEGELTRMSRRKGRRFRRQIKRLEKHKNRCDKIGGVAEVFNYRDLYKAGKKCCNGVRWKQSVQNLKRICLVEQLCAAVLLSAAIIVFQNTITSIYVSAAKSDRLMHRESKTGRSKKFSRRKFCYRCICRV